MYVCESLDISLQTCGHIEVKLTNDIGWKESPGLCILEEANGATSGLPPQLPPCVDGVAAIPLAPMAASATRNVSLIHWAIGVRVDMKSRLRVKLIQLVRAPRCEVHEGGERADTTRKQCGLYTDQS